MELTKDQVPSPQRDPGQAPLYKIGDWYWVKQDKKLDYFGCVIKVGSNFVEFDTPGQSSIRVHEDELEDLVRREENPEAVIKKETDQAQATVQKKLGEIRALTARLGMAPRETTGAAESESRSLSVLSSEADPKKYKKSLVLAKEKELPKLFEEVKKAHERLAMWMSAPAIGLQAMADGMEDVVEKIDDRIFNVSLYAGLAEEVVEIRKGEPAAASEKLRLFQRLLYMDEECLMDYRHGGMEFKNLKAFHRWLAEPQNLERLLPFPRCAAAFRIRRHEKDREWNGSLAQAFINFELGQTDAFTFFYVRNGERLYCISTKEEFGRLIFPNREELDLTEPMMAKTWGSKIDEIIPKRTFDQMVEDLRKELTEKQRKHDEWAVGKDKKDLWKSPFRSMHSFDDVEEAVKEFSRDYKSFDKSSVYYDEMEKEIANRIRYYNRIALILQGLFDRSEVLNPHPPVQLWDPEGFQKAVELVYDGDHTLHQGEAPDFEAYRQKLNESLREGSLTIGQDAYWGAKEAKKDYARNSWRQNTRLQKYHAPYGNPGPGYISKIKEWNKKKRRALFTWTRERRVSTWEHRYGEPLPAKVIVPDKVLFNVSGYKLGDYKAFFQDPRTRAQYLKWAPLLMAAEEYHAGNIDMESGELKRKKEKE